MKVINYGKDNITEWTGEYTCDECGALIEINRDDLKVINTAVGYAGETWEPVIVFDCPVCDSYVYVEQVHRQRSNLLPSGIRHKLLDDALEKHRCHSK